MSAEWFYSDGEERLGPVSEDALKRLASQGQLRPHDLVWCNGMENWVEAKTIQTLFPVKAEHLQSTSAGRDDGALRQRLDDAFTDNERPQSRSRRDDDYDDDRPRRRSSRYEDDDDDRPERSRSRRDDFDDDDDRPSVRRQRRSFHDDDYDDEPRPKKLQKPGQVQAVGIMLLIGGILGILVFLGFAVSIIGLCWPFIYLELIWGIFAIIRGTNMMNRDDQGTPTTLLILQVMMILNGDLINCVLGIIGLVMIGDEGVQKYYRKKGGYH